MRHLRNVAKGQWYGKQGRVSLTLNVVGVADADDNEASFKERNERTSSLKMRRKIDRIEERQQG
jgi:hypothetical protein